MDAREGKRQESVDGDGEEEGINKRVVWTWMEKDDARNQEPTRDIERTCKHRTRRPKQGDDSRNEERNRSMDEEEGKQQEKK